MNSNPSTPCPDQKVGASPSPTAGKLCMVCGDKALGYNFNAITCESCKAFFRRNALSNKEFTCPFNEDCKVTVVTRRFCQKCRLQKCFTGGMKKEYIMSEEDKVQKRKKIEQNRAKKRTSVSSCNNSNDSTTTIPLKIKREECSLDDDSWRDGVETPHSFTVKSPPDTFQNSASSYGSPASTSFDEQNPSPVQTPKFGLFSDFVPKYPPNSNKTVAAQTSSSSPTSTTNGFPHPTVVSDTQQAVTMESSPSEMVAAILGSQIGPKAVLDALMKTPSDAVFVMSKIINSPTDAMELIAHLIASPGDALHIISKIMNSPLDALTVFVQFMSSPTDAIQIIGKIMNSPSDVLQFMQQLMNSPEDATQIMNKYMNSPLEAIKKINQMINHQDHSVQPPVDSTTNGPQTMTTNNNGLTGDGSCGGGGVEDSKNAIVKSMLDAFQDGQHSFFQPPNDLSMLPPQPQLNPNSSLSCENTTTINQITYDDHHIHREFIDGFDVAGGRQQQRTEDIIIGVMDDLNSVFEQHPVEPEAGAHYHNTFDSVLCEAIRLEYESYNVEEQTSCSGRDLNSIEDVKLKELVIANEALYDSVDEYDMMVSFSTFCIDKIGVLFYFKLLTCTTLINFVESFL